MADALRLALAFFVAGGAALLLTPLAIRLAERTNFYDHPVGYKGHRRATPYLGGTAVVASVVISSALLGNSAGAFAPILVGALGLLALGTIDDRYGLGPLPRMLIEMCAAAGLYAAGVGWSIFSSDALNLIMTIVFVTGVVNAYNLMDNLDGATGSVAAATGAVLGVLAASEGNAALGAISLALCGACLGFLRFNLASPSRIFLGDGGSMPVGFVVSAVIMDLRRVRPPELGPDSGRRRARRPPRARHHTRRRLANSSEGRGASPAGGITSATVLLSRLGSPKRVALALAASQAADLRHRRDPLRAWQARPAGVGATALIMLGVAVVARLESPGWAPTTTTSESSA